MRNSALPFFGSNIPIRNASAPGVAKNEKEKKEKEEKERKEKERLAKQEARTAETIKEEGGVKSYRTRKLEDAKEQRGERQKARQAIRRERKKIFRKEGDTFTADRKDDKGNVINKDEVVVYGKKDKDTRREKRDNIKQLRKELQNKNREIRKDRAEKKKQAWIDKKVAKGVFKNAAEAEKRFNSIKANTVKSATNLESLVGNLASKERLGTDNDQTEIDVADENSDDVLTNNSDAFVIKDDTKINLMKV